MSFTVAPASAELSWAVTVPRRTAVGSRPSLDEISCANTDAVACKKTMTAANREKQIQAWLQIAPLINGSTARWQDRDGSRFMFRFTQKPGIPFFHIIRGNQPRQWTTFSVVFPAPRFAPFVFPASSAAGQEALKLRHRNPCASIGCAQSQRPHKEIVKSAVTTPHHADRGALIYKW
jgi:hypothetical protein